MKAKGFIKNVFLLSTVYFLFIQVADFLSFICSLMCVFTYFGSYFLPALCIHFDPWECMKFSKYQVFVEINLEL